MFVDLPAWELNDPGQLVTHNILKAQRKRIGGTDPRILFEEMSNYEEPSSGLTKEGDQKEEDKKGSSCRG